MIIRHASQLLNTQRNVRGPCTVIIIPIFNNSSGNLHMILNCLYVRKFNARGGGAVVPVGDTCPKLVQNR